MIIFSGGSWTMGNVNKLFRSCARSTHSTSIKSIQSNAMQLQSSFIIIQTMHCQCASCGLPTAVSMWPKRTEVVFTPPPPVWRHFRSELRLLLPRWLRPLPSFLFLGFCFIIKNSIIDFAVDFNCIKIINWKWIKLNSLQRFRIVFHVKIHLNDL